MPEFIAELTKIESRSSFGDILYRIILDNCYITPEMFKQLAELQIKDEKLVRIIIKEKDNVK